MTRSSSFSKFQLLQFATTFVVLLVVAGCDSSPARFRMDMVAMRIREDPENPFTSGQLQNLTNIMAGVFGTPDEPYIPADPELGIRDIVDRDNLKFAAGPVSHSGDGKPHGLYRRHCAHCHGISGGGDGPTARFLNPYPRDYRRGVFKFKSTPKGKRPTDKDLRRILINGIPGTAMPSFKLLPQDEINALVDYVKYLSIRGEVERQLIFELSDLDEPEEGEPESLLLPEDDNTDGLQLVKDSVSFVVENWQQAGESVREVPGRPDIEEDEHLHEWLAAHEISADNIQLDWNDHTVKKWSAETGREIFYGLIANCVKCHGNSALGDGQTTDYDDWTKELRPEEPEFMAELVELGRHPVRNIRPRNLRLGVYRGGRRPVDLYWRISNGIDGTPMPAVAMQPDNETGLGQREIWNLIDYVRSLPHESISRTPYEAQTPEHERAKAVW